MVDIFACLLQSIRNVGRKPIRQHVRIIRTGTYDHPGIGIRIEYTRRATQKTKRGCLSLLAVCKALGPTGSRADSRLTHRSQGRGRHVGTTAAAATAAVGLLVMIMLYERKEMFKYR